jgi:hypothetical protein
MREPKTSTTKFWIVAVAAVLIAAAGLAALIPATRAAAHSQSVALTSAAAQASGGEAEADYRLATWLDPHNQAAYLGLAQIQIAAGQADLAMTTLRRAGQGSEASRLRVRTLIELGRPAAAAAAASALTVPTASQSDLQLAGLTFALADHPASAITLIPRLSSPQAAQSVSRANSSKLTLATELYATGLLNSSSAILATQPVSFERNLLLARILYARHTAPELNQAASLLTAAVSINPTNLDARQLLRSVYTDQGNPAAAQQQTDLIAKLQTGRP